MAIELSILEFGYINPPELYAHQTINAMLEEVGHLDEAGYKRLWMTEHYSPEFAWFNPEMLLPFLAGYSENIKVGVAGVLLKYHSSLRVFQHFQILSAMFPNRVDLGLARAWVPDEISYALTYNKEQPSRDLWDQKVKEIFEFYYNKHTNKFKEMPLPPQGVGKPDVWMLGVSDSSVPTAVENGANFSISTVHPNSNPDKYVDALRRFKDEFYAKHDREPDCSIVIKAVADANKPNEVNELYALQGEPDFVAHQINEVSNKFDTKEIVVVDNTVERAPRLQQLLALQEAIQPYQEESVAMPLTTSLN